MRARGALLFTSMYNLVEKLAQLEAPGVSAKHGCLHPRDIISFAQWLFPAWHLLKCRTRKGSATQLISDTL